MTRIEKLLREALLHEQAALLFRQDADNEDARAKELRKQADIEGPGHET